MSVLLIHQICASFFWSTKHTLTENKHLFGIYTAVHPLKVLEVLYETFISFTQNETFVVLYETFFRFL